MNKYFLDVLENKVSYHYSDLDIEEVKKVKFRKKIKEYDTNSLISLLNESQDISSILYEILQQNGLHNSISEDFLEKKVNRKSTINFFRYFNYIIKYISNRSIFLDIDNSGNINLQIYAKNREKSTLDLVFDNDGKVSYLCLDKNFDKSELKTFVMRGKIETSNKLSKAYKIDRLLFLLIYLDYEDFGKIEHYLGSYNFNKINYKIV